MCKLDRTDSALIAVSILLASVQFLVDSNLELGVAAGVPYIVVVCLSYFATDRRWIFYTAALCCLLTVLGLLLSPSGGELWKVLFNRGLSLLAIVVTAIFASLAKRATERLAENEQDLERLVEQRTSELKQANDELEANNVELRQFAYVASHDLQTPLRAIHGFAEFLKEDVSGQLDEGANDSLDRILAASTRMKSLINDLLSYSRLESDTGRHVLVEMGGVFDEVVELLSSEIEGSGASVTREDLPLLVGDRGQLLQLLQNLIENGLKYRAQRVPEVQVFATLEDEYWVVSVKDNGIGIEPEYHERVFEIFRRLHDSKTYSGTGIGLAVCRRIVERHRGKIWIDTDTQIGTTVMFSIPDSAQEFETVSETSCSTEKG